MVAVLVVSTQEYDVEVVMLILERGVVVGLSLQGDRTKRCSNGELVALTDNQTEIHTRSAMKSRRTVLK